MKLLDGLSKIRSFGRSPEDYPTARRWIEIFCLATISALTTIALLSFAPEKIAKLTTIPLTIGIPAVCGLVLLLGSLSWGRIKPIAGYKTFFIYPPSIVAILFGLIMVGEGFTRLEKLAYQYEKLQRQPMVALTFVQYYNPGLIIILLILVLISIPFSPFLKKQNKIEGIPTGLTSKELDTWQLPDPEKWEEWRVWVMTDDSVKDPKADTFNSRHVAKRIVRRLLLSEKPPAQAVIGELGSGKTSIGNLVKWELETKPPSRRIEFIQIELWQYENAKAAVRGVVGELVSALQQEVAAFGLTELPAQYVEAMSAAGGGWSAVSKMFGWSNRPLDALSQIDGVACALNLRFVIWIEDLERYAGIAGKTPVNLSPQEFERVGPVRSLIYALNNMKSTSIILATTLPNDQMDLEKIALYVEEIRPLDPEKVRRVLGTFRRAAFDQFPDLIDPSAGEGRQDLDLLEHDATFSFALQLSNGEIFYASQAIPLLCRNPRILKQSLRKCFEFWNEHPGEIDFDALLVASILYYFSPDAFNYMRENSQRWLGRQSRSSGSHQPDDQTSKFLEKLGYNAVTSKAIHRMFTFLLGAENRKTRLQGFSEAHGNVKYWDRFLSNPFIPSEDSDQRLLKILENADPEEILTMLEGSQSSSVEHFQKLLPPDLVLGLLQSLVNRRSADRYQDWQPEGGFGARDQPPGLIALWRIWLTRRGYPEFMEKAIEAIKKAIETAVPLNLALAADLEYFFVVADSRSGNDFLGGIPDRVEKIQELKQHLRDLMMSAYGTNPELLVGRLTGIPQQILWWLCWGLDVVRKEEFPDLPFPRWSEFKKALLNAFEISPSTVAPHLAVFVVKMTSTFGGERYAYNPDLDSRLFDGEVLVRLRERMADIAQVIEDPVVKAVIEYDPSVPAKGLVQLPEPEDPDVPGDQIVEEHSGDDIP